MSYLINGVINDWIEVYFDMKQSSMGLSIDSMQQQAILVGTHSLSLRFESAYRTTTFMHSIYLRVK